MKKTYIAIRDINFPKFGINIKAGETFKLDEKQFAEVAHFGYGKWFDFTEKDVPEKAEVNPIAGIYSTETKEDVKEKGDLSKLKEKYENLRDKRSSKGKKIKAEIKRIEG